MRERMKRQTNRKICMRTCTFMHIEGHAYIHACMYSCVKACTNAVFVCMRVCVYACMYVRVYIHVNIYRSHASMDSDAPSEICTLRLFQQQEFIISVAVE